MTFTRLFLVAMALLPWSSDAEAVVPPCDSDVSCAALIHDVDQRIETVAADVVRQVTGADVMRDAVGQVLHANLWNAEHFCEDFGLRLPTAREMAVVAQSFGAAGIGEEPRTGYEFIRQPSDSNVEFYYNSYGYRRPESELGRHWFWTINPEAREGGDQSLAFGGGNGRFFKEEVFEALDPPGLAAGAVVCVEDAERAPHGAVCGGLDGCRALKAQAEAEAERAALKSGLPDLTEAPRNADGSVKHMGYGEALAHCRTLGLRLPTARELALFAQGRGGRLSETSLATYRAVGDFYYSALGCPRPDAALPDEAIWSSTPDPDFPTMMYVLDREGHMPAMFSDPQHVFSGDGVARCFRGFQPR